MTDINCYFRQFQLLYNFGGFMFVVDGNCRSGKIYRDNGRVQARIDGEFIGFQNFVYFQIVEFIYYYVVTGRIVDVLAQVERYYAVVFVIVVNVRIGGERNYLIFFIENAIDYFGKGFFIRLLSGVETFVKRCQFAQGNGYRFLLCGNVQLVLNGIVGGEVFCVVIDQLRGIDVMFYFCGGDIVAFYQIKVDRFAQDQRVVVIKNVVRQLVKLFILERVNIVINYKQRFFRYKRVKCMFKLRYVIEIDKKRFVDLDNGVVI